MYLFDTMALLFAVLLCLFGEAILNLLKLLFSTKVVRCVHVCFGNNFGFWILKVWKILNELISIWRLPSLALSPSLHDSKWEFDESMNFIYAELMNSKHFVVSNLWVGSFTLFDSVKRFLVIEMEKSHQQNFNSVVIGTFVLSLLIGVT